MAQSIFDALTGGISTIENQSAIQSLLESQTAVETAPPSVEDEDVFQCGKCKKQFTSLPLFVNHKQSRCTLPVQRPVSFQPSVLQGLGTNTLNGAVTQTIQKSPLSQTSLPSFTTVTQSTLNQLAPNMVLGDDQILAYSDLGSAVQNGLLQGQTIHLTGNTVQGAGPFLSQVTQLAPHPTKSNTGNTVQGAGPFLSQVTQLAPRPANSNVTILSPVQSTTSLSSTNGAALTNQVSVNNLQTLVQPTRQITLTTLPDIKPAQPNVIKPNVIKPGRKSSNNTLLSSALDNTEPSPRRRPRIGGGATNDMGKKILICTYCGKEFTKNFDLNQHIRSHTGEKPYQCVVCGRAFAQKSNVKKHMATHKVWPSGPVTTLPEQPPALLVPVEDQQKAEVTITTPALPEQQQQQQQEAVGTSEELTNKADKDQTSLENTQNYKLKVIVDNSYLCQYCPEKFKTYYQLKSHMVKHKHVQVYKCVVKDCDSLFKDLDAFLEHTTSHSDVMTYRCHQCNKMFTSLYDLGMHQITHSLYQHPTNKNGPRHFQCNKCMNKYSTPEALEQHINTTDHNYPCPHCTKVFTCERFLRRHLTFHGTEGLYQCDVCQKSFKTEHYLKYHALIHSGEKPFECEECGARFNRKDKLKRHNLIHDKKIRYRCPFRAVSGCEKEFNRPDKLKAHIITHSGVKPYACGICGKEFSRKPHLKEHERAHREDYPYNCKKCGRGFFRPKLFKEHKCEDANGQLIRKRNFTPRKVKRKPGRPRKVIRKQGADGQTYIFNAYSKSVCQRTNIKKTTKRQRKMDKAVESVTETEANKTAEADQSEVTSGKTTDNAVKNDLKADHAGYLLTTGLSAVLSDKTAENPVVSKYPVETPAEDEDIMMLPDSVIASENTEAIATPSDVDVAPKVKKPKPECYVKAPPPSVVPVSVVERYVTVHLTNTAQGDFNEMQAQLIPAGDFAGQIPLSVLQSGQIQISPSSSTATFHPLQIIEGQPVTLTVSQHDHLNALSVNESEVIDIPVDIVTVNDDRGLVCAQEVTNAGDAGEQTYTIGDYGTEGDVVLHGSENLINGSVEILGHDQVVTMATLEN